MRKRFFFVAGLLALAFSNAISLAPKIVDANEGINTNPDVCTLTFNPDGGNLSETTKRVIKEDNAGSLPTPASKDNKIFAGWYCNGVKVDENYKVTSDMVLTAKWSSNEQVVLTFDTKSGDPIDPKILSSGQTLNYLPKPTRDGYSFKGWYYDEKCTFNKVELPMTVFVDTTIYAGWTSETYAATVTLQQEDRFISVDAPKTANIKSAYRMTCVPKSFFSIVTAQVYIDGRRQTEGTDYTLSKTYDLTTDLTTYTLYIGSGKINGALRIHLTASALTLNVHYTVSEGVIDEGKWPSVVSNDATFKIDVKCKKGYRLTGFIVRVKGEPIEFIQTDTGETSATLEITPAVLENYSDDLYITLNAVLRIYKVSVDYPRYCMTIDSDNPPSPIKPTLKSGFRITFKTTTYCTINNVLSVKVGGNDLDPLKYSWKSGTADEPTNDWQKATLIIKEGVIDGDVSLSVGYTYNKYNMYYDVNKGEDFYHLNFTGQQEMEYKTDYSFDISPDPHYDLPKLETISINYGSAGTGGKVRFSYAAGKISIAGGDIKDDMMIKAKATPHPYKVKWEMGSFIEPVHKERFPEELNIESSPSETAYFEFKTVDDWCFFRPVSSYPEVFIGDTPLSRDQFNVEYSDYYHNMKISIPTGMVTGDVTLKANSAVPDTYSVTKIADGGHPGDEVLRIEGDTTCTHSKDYVAKVYIDDNKADYYRIPTKNEFDNHPEYVQIREWDRTGNPTETYENLNPSLYTFDRKSDSLGYITIPGQNIKGDLKFEFDRTVITRNIDHTGLPDGKLSWETGAESTDYETAGVNGYIATLINQNNKRFKFAHDNIHIKIGGKDYTGFSWRELDTVDKQTRYELMIPRSDIRGDIKISAEPSYFDYDVTFDYKGTYLILDGKKNANSNEDYVATIRMKDEFIGKKAFEGDGTITAQCNGNLISFENVGSKKSDSGLYYSKQIKILKENIEGNITITCPQITSDKHNLTYGFNGSASGSQWQYEQIKERQWDDGDIRNKLTMPKGYEIKDTIVKCAVVSTGQTVELKAGTDYNWEGSAGDTDRTLIIKQNSFVGNITVQVKVGKMEFAAKLNDELNYQLSNSKVVYEELFSTEITASNDMKDKFYAPDPSEITVKLCDLGKGPEIDITTKATITVVEKDAFNKPLKTKVEIQALDAVGSIKIYTKNPTPRNYKFSFDCPSDEATCSIPEGTTLTFNQGLEAVITAIDGTTFPSVESGAGVTVKCNDMIMDRSLYKVTRTDNQHQTIKIDGGNVLGNITIIQQTDRMVFSASLSGDKQIYNLSTNVVQYGMKFEATIAAKKGYEKQYAYPNVTKIEVTNYKDGQKTELDSNDYSYDINSGKLSIINTDKITGNIVITIDPIPMTYHLDTKRSNLSHCHWVSVPTEFIYGTSKTVSIAADSGYDFGGGTVQPTVYIGGTVVFGKDKYTVNYTEKEGLYIMEVTILGGAIIGDVGISVTAHYPTSVSGY